MREGIHPKYYQAEVVCNCGNRYLNNFSDFSDAISAGIELYYLALMHQWDEEITALCVIKEEEK